MPDQYQGINLFADTVKSISNALVSANEAAVKTFKDGTGRGLLVSGYVVTSTSIMLKFISGLDLNVAWLNAFFYSFPTADFAIMIGIGALLILAGSIINTIEYYHAIKRNNSILETAI